LKSETRFCTSPHGVGLAYAIDGEGAPLVKVGNWMTHLDYERQSPVWRHWVRELGRGRTLVRYDVRGCGLSDRRFEGMPTLDTYVADLAAVVDAARLERFALFGLAGGSPTAIEYAVRNPERVSRLVLYGAYARGRYRRSEGETEQSRVLIDLMRVGWGGTVPAFRQVFSSIFIPSANEEQKRWYDDMQQASSSGEMAARLEGRRLASLLPDARFVTLESDNHILQEGEPAWDAFLSEVRAFLGEDELAPTDARDIGELSGREREVLELVAAGMSNEQIAERLFLSTRTVERHLSNVYARLRLSGKSARAAAAARFSRA